MKAEEYLKSKRLKNPPLDSGISGGGDAPRIRVSDMMNEYAKYQVKRMYTEEDLRQAYNYGMFAVTSGRNFKDWFTNYKKK